jgi:toxin ParE1/3/4
MANYKLTLQAEADLHRIYARGVREFGEAQADRYFVAFFDQFEKIAQNPYAYPSVDHLRQRYHRSICGMDSIYYRIQHDSIIEIMTIIGRQDVRIALTQDDEF